MKQLKNIGNILVSLVLLYAITAMMFTFKSNGEFFKGKSHFNNLSLKISKKKESKEQINFDSFLEEEDELEEDKDEVAESSAFVEVLSNYIFIARQFYNSVKAYNNHVKFDFVQVQIIKITFLRI